MIKNYLKVAVRNLLRNKFFSIINIFGLALGMACSVLILLWVQDELSVDAWHANGKNLYAIVERQYYDHKITGQYNVPAVLAAQMKKALPEVEYATQLDNDEDNTFQVGEKIIKTNGAFADSDLFRMFSYKLLEGNTQTALNSPSAIAISRKMAQEFYGSPQAAIGKNIRYENKQDFKIAAVYENLPENSSIKFDYVLNWFQYFKDNPWMIGKWDNNSPLAYIQLRPSADPVAFHNKIARFMDAYYKNQTPGFREELGIQKFGDVYLHGDLTGGKPSGGRIQYVYLFTIIAVFILLIACINFMNLATARSIKRAREIGVRKVVGAVRPILIFQFIGEAVFLTFLAVVIAIVLVALLLPQFNAITGKQIAFPFGQLTFWLGLAALTLVTGLIAGSYPALFLSSFNPVMVLKGALKLRPESVWFRKGLVVFQFFMSILLIIGTIVVSRQVSYIQTKNLGYNRENLLYVPIEGDLSGKYETFKTGVFVV